ncbi:mitochondrial protein [Kwoniella heveanensis BCC8398]|uniref:Mitochondrial protein n=1 Tax=Kwoniella heveanensis BCC8398 TaxID=1296120 RepID=A0A1B9H2A6_9TREE|nr:mitochondrial protein [Kwoniella heveanensis BCC8398]
MDPNAEDRPPPVEVVVVDVEGSSDATSDPSTAREPSASDAPGKAAGIESHDFGLKDRPIAPPVIQAPLASSIFRTALGSQPAPVTFSNTPASASHPERALPDRAEPATEDAEKIRQWQEEEFQRRLRGEYEQAQRRVSDVVSDNMDRPLRLTSIRLAPTLKTTRPSFLSAALSPFLAPPSTETPSFLNPAPPPPRNLHEILRSTKALVSHLDQFGVYDMERAGIRFEPRRGGDPDEVEMVLALREKGRLFLKAGTEVGGGEGGGNATAKIRNVFGGAETLEANASLGTKTKSAYQLALSTPLLASPLLSFALSAFSLDRDNSAFASHRERAQGGRAKLSAITPWGTHDLQYELVNREIDHLTPNASVSIRELAVPSTKSSLSHTWTSDTRDDLWTGTSGRLLKLTHEYAGLPGSSERAHFFKSTTQSQLSRALYPGSNIHYSISSLTTLLLPLFSGTFAPSADGSVISSPTYLPDRTYLGGPNSVRGWKVGGIGRRDGPDSLGGDLSWGLGLSVFSPIPKKEHWPLKLHAFLNGGKVVSYDQTRSLAENISKLYTQPNLSFGVGLMYRLEPIRIELNFSMPLIGRKGERTARGLGVGVGIEFL